MPLGPHLSNNHRPSCTLQLLRRPLYSLSRRTDSLLLVVLLAVLPELPAPEPMGRVSACCPGLAQTLGPL